MGNFCVFVFFFMFPITTPPTLNLGYSRLFVFSLLTGEQRRDEKLALFYCVHPTACSSVPHKEDDSYLLDHLMML